MTLLSKTLHYDGRNSPITVKERNISLPLKPNFIVVKVSYVALNPVDSKIKSTAYFHGGTAGLDFSGTVQNVASNLKDKYEVGERVFGFAFSSSKQFVGSLALLDVTNCAILKVPAKYSDEEAAALPLTFATAVEMIQKTKLGPDSRILVLGAGTVVGSFCIQLAKKIHKVKEIVVTCSPKSEKQARSLGADVVIDYTKGDVPAELVKAANGHKFQAVLDAVGGYGAIQVSYDILAPVSEGSAYISVMGDQKPGKTYATTITIWTLFNFPRLAFRYYFGRYYGLNYWFLMVGNDGFNGSAGILEENDFKVPIDSVYPLEDVQNAWDKLDSTHAHGKILIDMS